MESQNGEVTFEEFMNGYMREEIEKSRNELSQIGINPDQLMDLMSGFTKEQFTQMRDMGEQLTSAMVQMRAKQLNFKVVGELKQGNLEETNVELDLTGVQSIQPFMGNTLVLGYKGKDLHQWVIEGRPDQFIKNAIG